MFPLQIGGLLVCNLPMRLEKVNQIPPERLRHLKNVLSNQIKSKERIIRNRISNYNFLKDKFELLGFSERFHLDNGILPGVFMFRNNEQQLSLPDLTKYFYAHGIQCSVFYTEDSFYIPVHQALNEHDMLYFHEVIKSFIQRSNL